LATAKRFEDLEAWQKARQLAITVYRVSSSGRFNRDFVLRDQARRAVVSIVSNIAEGFERGGNREFMQFLAMSKGSCGELRAQLHLAKDLAYLSEGDFELLMNEALRISRMLSGLLGYLRQSDMRGSKYGKPPANLEP